LSPMMCSRILQSHRQGEQRPKFELWLDNRFERLREGYQRKLHGALDSQPVMLTFALIILVSCYFLFVSSPAELEPAEDQGFVFTIGEADSYATLDYVTRNSEQYNKLYEDIPEVENLFVINGFNGT